MKNHSEECGNGRAQPDERWRPHQRGAGLAEYGMLMFFLLFACLAIMLTFGQTLANQFDLINTAFAGLN